MSHQRSNVRHFSPLNVQVLEKSFLPKSCSISKNQHKTALENINFAHTKYLWVIKGQLYVIFPLLMYKSWRTIFKGKPVPLVKTNTDCFKKHQFCAHKVSMSHQRSIVRHCFPLNVQVLEKSFLTKSCSISENQHKTVLENINFAHTNYLWVIKCQLYVIFFLLMSESWRKIS